MRRLTSSIAPIGTSDSLHGSIQLHAHLDPPEDPVDGSLFDGMVEHDGQVGQLLKKLDDLGIADNTIVIYTTDNGAKDRDRCRRRAARRRGGSDNSSQTARQALLPRPHEFNPRAKATAAPQRVTLDTPVCDPPSGRVIQPQQFKRLRRINPGAC